jgi:hypothetical protein
MIPGFPIVATLVAKQVMRGDGSFFYELGDVRPPELRRTPEIFLSRVGYRTILGGR